MARLDSLGDFERLCLRLLPKIQRLILERSGDPQLAEEIAHETLLQAYRSRHTFDPSRPMLPWLTKIAVRIYARERSKQVPTVPLDLIDEKELAGALLPDHDPEAKMLNAEGEFLWSLRPRYRRALLSKYVLNLDYKEIAKLEEISFSGVVSLLRRARVVFRRTTEAARDQIQTLLWFPIHTAGAQLRARTAHTQRTIEAAVYSFGLTAGIRATVALMAIGMSVAPGSLALPPTFATEISIRIGQGENGDSRVALAAGVRSVSFSTDAETESTPHIPTGSLTVGVSTSDLSPTKPPVGVEGHGKVRRDSRISYSEKWVMHIGDRRIGISNGGDTAWFNCQTDFVPHRVTCDAYDDILVPQWRSMGLYEVS